MIRHSFHLALESAAIGIHGRDFSRDGQARIAKFDGADVPQPHLVTLEKKQGVGQEIAQQQGGVVTRKFEFTRLECSVGGQVADDCVQPLQARRDEFFTRWRPRADDNVRRVIDQLESCVRRHVISAFTLGPQPRFVGRGGNRNNAPMLSDAQGDRTGLPRVALTGSTGLIARHLRPQLIAQGYRVDPMVRREPRPGTTEFRWDPEKGEIDRRRLKAVDAVIHLAAKGIADGRWTKRRKAEIRESRVRGTTLLAETLARLQRRPRVLVSASGMGYYGDRGNEVLTEGSAAGCGFLPEVCEAWEAATKPAADAGIRVVLLRIGMVLAPDGGALAQMLPTFRWGLGGRFGSGRQYSSWISITDLVNVILRALDDDTLSGPVNAVSPQPMTNNEFTATLGNVLSRRTFLPVPSFALRLMLGEMADHLLLASTRMLPARLTAIGFPFQHAELETALRACIQPRTDVVPQ